MYKVSYRNSSCFNRIYGGFTNIAIQYLQYCKIYTVTTFKYSLYHKFTVSSQMAFSCLPIIKIWLLNPFIFIVIRIVIYQARKSGREIQYHLVNSQKCEYFEIMGNNEMLKGSFMQVYVLFYLFVKYKIPGQLSRCEGKANPSPPILIN